MNNPLDLPEITEYICENLELACKLKSEMIKQYELKHIKFYVKTKEILNMIIMVHNFKIRK